MPAHRKPVELLALSGAFEKNPQRRRPIGPKSSEPVGEPPACLAPEETAAWREFCRDAPAGVLTGGDRWALEALCRLLAKCPGAGPSPRPNGASCAASWTRWGQRPAAR